MAAQVGLQDGPAGGKLYRVVDGKVDERTYNGFPRYHAGCNHCHGQPRRWSRGCPASTPSAAR
jgi:hypothetical protein